MAQESVHDLLEAVLQSAGNVLRNMGEHIGNLGKCIGKCREHIGKCGKHRKASEMPGRLQSDIEE